MNLREDISIYLPKYLSEESQDKLFQELKNFPHNDSNKFYSALEDNFVFQGDAIKDIPFLTLPEPKIEKTLVLILSNTCDVEQGNIRLFPAFVNYCPLIKLSKYINLLEKKNVLKSKIESHLQDIKSQRITQIMFFPKGKDLDDDYIAFFERVNHIKNDFIKRETLEQTRLFSLSNFGFYLLLIKLSIHYTRIREGVDRKI
jgi:hypothetical protein